MGCQFWSSAPEKEPKESRRLPERYPLDPEKHAGAALWGWLRPKAGLSKVYSETLSCRHHLSSSTSTLLLFRHCLPSPPSEVVLAASRPCFGIPDWDGLSKLPRTPGSNTEQRGCHSELLGCGTLEEVPPEASLVSHPGPTAGWKDSVGHWS